MTPVVMERRTVDDPPKNPSTPEKTQTPQASQSAQAAAMSSPAMVRTGEIMLILSLLLIFLVACCVSFHFYLRSRKRRNKKSGKTKDNKKKNKKGKADGPPELHSQQKRIAELVGTPICEIGDSEPRHEMEDVEVQEVMTPMDEPIGSAISTFGHTAIPAIVHPAPEPEIREFATYWSARM